MSESHLMEQAGRKDWEKSNYERAHLRMLTAKCIWQCAGKPFWVWDYPRGKTPKEQEKNWLRSIIFDPLHDAIIGVAVCSKTQSNKMGPYRIASDLVALAQKPLGEIVANDNIVYRYYHPGIILMLETKSTPWSGTVEIPIHILNALGKNSPLKISCRLFSEDKYKLDCARINSATTNSLALELEADGCAVIAI